MLLDKFGSLIHFTNNRPVTSYSRSTFLVATEQIIDVSLFNGTSYRPNDATTLSIPSGLFDELSIHTNSSARLVYTAFPNVSALFYTPDINVLSAIIGATIPGLEVNNLSENNTIRIGFTSVDYRVSYMYFINHFIV